MKLQGLLLLIVIGSSVAPAQPCSNTTYQAIAKKVPTGDAQGHGPDIGSDEWKSVVEFKLGVRGQPGVPSRDSAAWCDYIEQRVNQRESAAKSGAASAANSKQGPSFECSKVEPGSIKAMICASTELSALDRKLAGVYKEAAQKATDEHPPMLKAEQRGWIKGRDECWKSTNKIACVHNEYVHRIAELQARYKLVPATGPIFYFCDGNPANEVVVTFFETDPPTLIAEHGDSTSLMYVQPSGSGARYQGRNESFWEHQGEATVIWGYGAAEMRCKKKP